MQPAPEQPAVPDSGRIGHDVSGRTRRGRLVVLSAVGLALMAGLLVAMAQGAIAASFTISGALGKLSADDFVGRGVAQYGSVERSGEQAFPVLVAGFREAHASNFCYSVPVIDLPGTGPVVLRLATPGEQGFQAENLMVSAQELTGDVVQRDVELGRDAAELDKGPGEATGRPGGFGLQSTTLEITNFRQRPRAVIAGTMRLNQVRIAIGADERECF